MQTRSVAVSRSDWATKNPLFRMLWCVSVAPFGEPVVSHGPFVMNTREEILQAFADYQAGKFTTPV